MQRDEHGRFKKNEQDRNGGENFTDFLMFSAKLLLFFVVVGPWYFFVFRTAEWSPISKIFNITNPGGSPFSNVYGNQVVDLPGDIQNWVKKTEEKIRKEVFDDVAAYELERRQKEMEAEKEMRHSKYPKMTEEAIKRRQNKVEMEKGSEIIDLITNFAKSVGFKSRETQTENGDYDKEPPKPGRKKTKSREVQFPDSYNAASKFVSNDHSEGVDMAGYYDDHHADDATTRKKDRRDAAVGGGGWGLGDVVSNAFNYVKQEDPEEN